jgi:hypothetical protein
MTPAALLVCMAIVTNVDHGSVITRQCHYEQQASSEVTQSIDPATPDVTLNSYPMPEPVVKARISSAVKAKPARLYQKKKIARQAKIQVRRVVTKTKPMMTAEQNRKFRLSWFDRLAAQ